MSGIPRLKVSEKCRASGCTTAGIQDARYNAGKGVGTLRSLVTNNVRCGNLIYCCYSVYELLELL